MPSPFLRLNFGVRLRVGFPGDSMVKNPPSNARDTDSTPRWERSPGEGNGHPLQHSYLENPMDREACRATVHGVAKELNMTD